MGEYIDNLGVYTGQISNGFPHGIGDKQYYNGSFFSGPWQQGRKHGRGIMIINLFTYDLEFSFGYPTKVFSVSNDENQTIKRLKIHYLMRPAKRNEGYEEEHDSSAIFNLYCNSHSELIFQGRLFHNELKNYSMTSKMIVRQNGEQLKFVYYGEHNDEKIPFGFGQLCRPLWYYEGYINDFAPHGQGKVVGKNGIEITGTFDNGRPNGEFLFKDSEAELTWSIKNSEPEGVAQILFKNRVTRFIKNGPMLRFLDVEDIDKEVVMKVENFLIYFSTACFCFSVFYEASILKKQLVKKVPNPVSWKAYEEGFLPSNKSITQYLLAKEGEYYGELQNGLRHGKGKMKFANGEFYEGEWANNNFHGFGRYHYKDGSVYYGNFLNNKKHGLGTFRSPTLQYKGSWSNDVFHGPGALSFATHLLTGTWSKAQLSGPFRIHPSF
jgi:hypothetical protein